MFKFWSILCDSLLDNNVTTFFAGQLLLSPTSFTVFENSSFIVTCTHAAGAEVLLTGLISAYDITLPPASTTVTTFNISRVSRLDYNKQFTCTQSNVPPSSPANLTVICKLTS